MTRSADDTGSRPILRDAADGRSLRMRALCAARETLSGEEAQHPSRPSESEAVASWCGTGCAVSGRRCASPRTEPGHTGSAIEYFTGSGKADLIRYPFCRPRHCPAIHDLDKCIPVGRKVQLFVELLFLADSGGHPAVIIVTGIDNRVIRQHKSFWRTESKSFSAEPP